MVVAAAYAPLIRDFGSLFQYFQSTLAYLVPPIVAVYFVGFFWRRATATGAFSALVSGLALGLTLFVFKEVTGGWSALGLPDVHFTYMALLMCAFAALVAAAVSLAGPAPPAAKVDEATFRRSDLGAGAPGGGAPALVRGPPVAGRRPRRRHGRRHRRVLVRPEMMTWGRVSEVRNLPRSAIRKSPLSPFKSA